MSLVTPDQGGQPAETINSIRQFDLLALPAAQQEEELVAFEERLRQWAGRMAAVGGGGPDTVSVEIPVYKAGWVMPCVESVLYQSSTCWSLSIRWDGGDDLSRRILETLERINHPKIHVYFGENRGIAYNRRFLTEHSHGEFIIPLDDDDMLSLDAVEKFLAAARQRPWSGLIRARRDFIDEVGRPVESDPWFPFEPRHYQHGMVQDVFNHSQPTLISRAAYVKTSGWEGFEEFRFAGEDCDLYIKIEEVAPIELLDEVLYFYRISDRRTSLVLTDHAAFEMWRRLADAGIRRLGLPLRRTNEQPPFTYERLPRPTLTADAIEIVRWPPVDGARARNEGFAATTRPLVCFVRAGVELPTDALSQLLAALQQHDADLAGPGQGEATWLSSTLLLVRREVVKAVGGFEPGRNNLIADKDFSLKARQRDFVLVHAESVHVANAEPDATVRHGDAEWLMAKWEDRAEMLASVDGMTVSYKALYEQGTAAAGEGRAEDAEKLFRRVARIKPTFSWAYHSLGDALFQLERWEEALAAYQQAIALKPDVSWTHHHAGNVLAKLGRWQQAADAQRQAIAVDPAIAAAHKNLALALLRVGRAQEAAEACDAALRLDPNDFWSHYSRGDAYTGLQQWAEAAESYERAIALQADVPWAFINLGNALVKLERWADSAAAFRRAIELQPDSAAPLVSLGNALSKLDLWAEAAAVCQRAIDLDPKLFWAHQFQGIAFLKVRQWDAAEAALARAIALNPGFAWSHHYRGDALVQLERLEEAAAEFRRAVELEPSLFWAHNNLAETLLKLRRVDEAVDACYGAIAARPDQSGAYHNLGDALVKSSRWEEAAAAFRQADEINPAWSRRDLGPRVAALEQTIDQMATPPAPVTPTDEKARLLFVLDSDYGELTTAMYLLLGQELARRTRLLLPPRLHVINEDSLPGRTQVYQSAQEVLDAVDAFKPTIVVLASGYLFPIHEIFQPDVLQNLVNELTARGCRVVTTDPFLGLLSNLGTSTTISIDIPDNAPPQLVKVKEQQDRRLIENFSKAVEILRDLPHLYPAFPAPPGAAPRTDEVTPVSFFNPELLIAEPAGETPEPPQWVFVLASRDYEVQVIFHGRDWFIDVLAAKLEESVRAGRHPVFIGPYGCVQGLIQRLSAPQSAAVRDQITLLTFCPFKRFSALLLNAEYVFYWNALSHSMFLRLFNQQPVFLFDRGHLVRNVIPLYERIVDWYYQGWEPVYLDQKQPLDAAVLEPLADAYRQGAREIDPHMRRSPSPEAMIERLS